MLIRKVLKVNIISTRSLSFHRNDEIRHVLRNVIEPITQSSLITLNCIKNITVKEDSLVDIKLDLLVPGYPYINDIKRNCIESLNQLSWIKSINIEIINASITKSQPSVTTGALDNVKHVIAVSSCKGGVGKSTIALNIANSLASTGLAVGLLDTDVYGPSLPSLVNIKDLTVRKSKLNPNFIVPLIDENNIKVMSFGFVNSKSGAPGAGGKAPALMRGPVATKVINQLIGTTEWGHLDYLIVDMPPGTGDIQITLCQTISFTGAIIITTPHKLSLVDAAKGVTMFHDLHVPILAIVENMSYFKGDDKIYHPFGKGGKEKIITNLKNLDYKIDVNTPTNILNQLESVPYYSLPLTNSLSDGLNLFINNNQSDDDNSLKKLFINLTNDIISEILKIELSAHITPTISYIKEKGIVIRYFTSSNAFEYILKPEQLRIRDPKTGDIKLNEKIDHYKSIYPVRFEYKGNYGVAIHWSDGHYADIFPYIVLRKIIESIEHHRQ